MFVPFLVHRKLNGPVPLGTVLKLAGVPRQIASGVNAVALVLVSTVSEAQLVTLVQRPVISTQYWPASPAVTPLIVTELFVWPGRPTAFGVQRYVNGPVPFAIVLKVAPPPGQ